MDLSMDDLSLCESDGCPSSEESDEEDADKPFIHDRAIHSVWNALADCHQLLALLIPRKARTSAYCNSILLLLPR